MARAAKQSGSAGIIFDPEPYPSDKAIVPFSYERQPQRGQHSFVEYQRKAIQLGRESMQAMSSEFPDMCILYFFLTSYLTENHTFRGSNVVGGDSPQQEYAVHKYNLLVPFLTGWLAEAPKSMRIIDGNEEAYYYTRQTEYLAAAHRIKESALQLLPSELHKKHQDCVQVGSAIYLDNCLPTHRLYTEIRHNSLSQILERRLDWAAWGRQTNTSGFGPKMADFYLDPNPRAKSISQQVPTLE